MPRIRTAHKFSERQRTGDVLTDELVDFKSLLLSPDVLKGLNSSGFERPSPIQLKAIPLGRCGLDLIAQAKSGTGKTCVFSVIALESVLPDSNTIQVLILAPTREIAVQIKDVITAIGSQMESMACHVFIGGLPVDENKKLLKKPCHIAVGTPGRIKYLIENHFLKTESVRLFILDEADKLLEDNFQEQINWIFSSLPSNKQMMAFSATYPEYLAKHLTRYMREPTFVRLNATDPTLQGIRQFYRTVPFHPLPHKTFQEKVTELLKLLSSLSFHQCLVFSNYQIRAQSLCDTLRLKGWPSVFIAGSQTQSQRLKAMERLKQFKCRVLISTDLTSRGIDAENVNLVVNMDVPRDSETYLHRIGRAGRFGTQGVAVTFVAKGEEEKLFKRMEENIGTTIDVLPDPIPQSLGTSGTPAELDSTKVQPKTTSIEVDILKGGNKREPNGIVNQNSTHLNEIQNCTKNSEEENDAGEIVCIGDQRSGTADLAEDECLNTDAKILSNHDPPQKLQIEGNVGPSKNADSEMQEMLANIQERLQTTLHLDQNCEEENINGNKVFHNVQRKGDGTLPQRNETVVTAATNFQDTHKASLCHDVEENELKKDHKPPLPFATSEENSSVDKDSLHKLQAGPHSESTPSFKETTNDLVNEACGKRHDTQQNNKDKTVDHKLATTSADEANSSGSQSEDESTSDSSSESEESSDGLDFDGHDASKRTTGAGNFLPPVEEFEKDLEEYLANVSNVHDNSVENLPHSSESSDDDLVDGDSIHSERRSHCFNTKDDDFDETPTETYVVSQYPNTLHGTCYQITHQDRSTGFYNGQCNGVQNQTDDLICEADYHENILSEGSWNNHHPYNGFWDGYCSFSSNPYCNYYNDQGYNDYYSAYYGNNPANWPTNTQGQVGSVSLQQCTGQFDGDTGSDQEHQWNTSWYNAYHRQTSCIRQFVSFSRSLRFQLQ